MRSTNRTGKPAADRVRPSELSDSAGAVLKEGAAAPSAEPVVASPAQQVARQERRQQEVRSSPLAAPAPATSAKARGGAHPAMFQAQQLAASAEVDAALKRAHDHGATLGIRGYPERFSNVARQLGFEERAGFAKAGLQMFGAQAAYFQFIFGDGFSEQTQRSLALLMARAKSFVPVGRLVEHLEKGLEGAALETAARELGTMAAESEAFREVLAEMPRGRTAKDTVGLAEFARAQNLAAQPPDQQRIALYAKVLTDRGLPVAALRDSEGFAGLAPDMQAAVLRSQCRTATKGAHFSLLAQLCAKERTRAMTPAELERVSADMGRLGTTLVEKVEGGRRAIAAAFLREHDLVESPLGAPPTAAQRQGLVKNLVGCGCFGAARLILARMRPEDGQHRDRTFRLLEGLETLTSLGEAAGAQRLHALRRELRVGTGDEPLSVDARRELLEYLRTAPDAEAHFDDVALATAALEASLGVVPLRGGHRVGRSHVHFIELGRAMMPASLRANVERLSALDHERQAIVEGDAYRELSAAITASKGVDESARAVQDERFRAREALLLGNTKARQALETTVGAQMTQFRAQLVDSARMTLDDARSLVAEIDIAEDIRFNRNYGKTAVGEYLADVVRFCDGLGVNRVTTLTETHSRAYFSSDRGEVNVGDRVASLWHEWGHSIEAEVPALLRASLDWRDDRRSDDVAVPLNWLANNESYSHWESAFPGKAISPYVLKDYGADATEVLSMGLEHFAGAAGMTRLAREDLEHFLYTLGAIRHLSAPAD